MSVNGADGDHFDKAGLAEIAAASEAGGIPVFAQGGLKLRLRIKVWENDPSFIWLSTRFFGKNRFYNGKRRRSSHARTPSEAYFGQKNTL